MKHGFLVCNNDPFPKKKLNCRRNALAHTGAAHTLYSVSLGETIQQAGCQLSADIFKWLH